MFPKKCLLECSGLSGNQDPALNLASGSPGVQRPEVETSGKVEFETEAHQSFSLYWFPHPHPHPALRSGAAGGPC